MISLRESGDSFVNFELLEKLVANGEISFCFRITAESKGFRGVGQEIWIEEDELRSFNIGLEKLIASKLREITLKAMSECSLHISHADEFGYFSVKLVLSHAPRGHSLTLNLRLPTGALIHFLGDLPS